MICIVLIIIIAIWGRSVFWPEDPVFTSETVIVISKGDTLAKVYQNLPTNQQLSIKLFAKSHPDRVPSIQEWTYIFSGNYTPADLFTLISQWPVREYLRYTVLEGRSIYDIDADLANKGYIQPGEYISYTTNPDKITELSQRYDFFDGNISSLEGFLYPDTYHLDEWDNLVRQLVSIQLNTFKSKVREPNITAFSQAQQKYNLSYYKLIILASIVEKEEKKSENKPTIAWIFYNRLQQGMLIWADITLCYHFHQPYADCTPKIIAKNVSDSKNPYNTRAVSGLPPTPIANPDSNSIQSVLNPAQTSYLFYLHSPDGTIHYATTNAQHEKNKSDFL